ncbi:MAG: response regulator [Myxococcales bacterium]
MVRSFASPSNPLSRYKVLLVDDDVTVLRGLAAALEFDLDIVTCASAEQALALLEEQDFHAVCCDYSMPGMNGLELFERIAKSKRPVACLLLTGSMSFIDRGGSVDEYVLLKPVDPARLSALLRQLSHTVEMKRSASRSNLAPRPGAHSPITRNERPLLGAALGAADGAVDVSSLPASALIAVAMGSKSRAER